MVNLHSQPIQEMLAHLKIEHDNHCQVFQDNVILCCGDITYQFGVHQSLCPNLFGITEKGVCCNLDHLQLHMQRDRTLSKSGRSKEKSWTPLGYHSDTTCQTRRAQAVMGMWKAGGRFLNNNISLQDDHWPLTRNKGVELNNPSFEMSGEAKYTAVEMRIKTPWFAVKLVTKMVLVEGEGGSTWRATSKLIMWGLLSGLPRRRQVWEQVMTTQLKLLHCKLKLNQQGKLVWISMTPWSTSAKLLASASWMSFLNTQ